MYFVLKILLVFLSILYVLPTEVFALPDLTVSSFSSCWVPGIVPKNDVVFKSVVEKNIGDTVAPAHKSRITPIGIDLECVSPEYINYFEFNVPVLVPGATFTPTLFPLSYNSTCGTGWMGLEYLANSNSAFSEGNESNNEAVINPVDHCSYSCDAVFTPSSGTVSQGQNFDLQGRITNISASGRMSAYSYMWATAFNPGSYNFPPSVNPTGIGSFIGQWNSSSFTPRPVAYKLIFLMTIRSLGWNHSVACNGSSDVIVVSPTPIPTATPTQVPAIVFDSWFQTKGGDVYSGNDIVSKIPGTAVDRNFSQDLWGVPGLVQYAGNNYDFAPSGIVSSREWLANDGANIQTDFNGIFQKVGSPTEPNWDGTPGNFVFPRAGSTSILYTGDKIANIPGGNYSGGKLIVLSKNNINIENNITIQPGSFMAIITSSSIYISPSTDHVEGIYFAGGGIGSGIFTGSEGDNVDIPLVVEGEFYANKINLERSLPDVSNKIVAAENIIFRPDFIINAPRELFSSGMSWQEVTP